DREHELPHEEDAIGARRSRNDQWPRRVHPVEVVAQHDELRNEDRDRWDGKRRYHEREQKASAGELELGETVTAGRAQEDRQRRERRRDVKAVPDRAERVRLFEEMLEVVDRRVTR